jgi:UDP-galactopyranose mutase
MKYKVKCLIPGTYNNTFLKRYVGKYPEENTYRNIVWDTTNKQTLIYQTEFTLSELEEILGQAVHHKDVFELIEVQPPLKNDNKGEQ